MAATDVDAPPPARTVLHAWHVAAGAGMHAFGGYDMPIQYQAIVPEHLATRRAAGLFDTSHMGRFRVAGAGAVPFLQRALTNDVEALAAPGQAQYTLLADDAGGALDDAYLYRLTDGEYLLVVNAGNRIQDWQWLQQLRQGMPLVELVDDSERLAMIALQGPAAEAVLMDLLAAPGSCGNLPEPRRNRCSGVVLGGRQMMVARTGYTGEPVCFELFPPTDVAVELWERLLVAGRPRGVVPVGLGARDTLRLEAGLPLYGHELGSDPNGKAIPIYALPGLAELAVSLVAEKGDFVGRAALSRQREEVIARAAGCLAEDAAATAAVPRYVRRLAVVNPDRSGPSVNPVRGGHQLLHQGRRVGWVTSGTTVPCAALPGDGAGAAAGPDKRAIALAYVDADLMPRRANADLVAEKAPGRTVPVALVARHLRATATGTLPVLYAGLGR
jgi:aminomethyltransferase